MRSVVVVVWCVLSMACAQSVLSRAVEIPTYSSGYTASDGKEMASAVADLETRLKGWGVTIMTLDPTDKAAGRALVVGGPRTIYLQAGLSPNARLEVLAHEAGHLFQSPALEDRSTAEMFAELVSVGVCRYYKHDTRDVAARYLAGYKSGFSAHQYLKADIDAAVKALTGQGQLPNGWQR